MSNQLKFPSEKLNFRIPYEEELNTSQLEAVTFREGPLLIIAGAGSGKTRTLTYRVARLVEEGVEPSSILLLTFTRKAAHEMIKRATQLLDNRCGKVAGGTFHSFANTILHRYPSKIGFDQGFGIIDRTDAEDIISMLRKEKDMASKHRSFPRKRTLATIFSKSVNKMMSIEDIILNEYPHFNCYIKSILTLYDAYKRSKIQNRFLDYDDLLVYLKHLLEDYPDICEKVSSTYRYIMVDEYQDTNRIQADIIYLLSRVNKNIMIVGDDSQSIYAFRGANFKNIMKFPVLFPGTRIIRLEENYRSVQPILNLTNIIIERAKEKYTKRLFTQKSGGALPLLVNTGSEHGQSGFILEKIRELNQKRVPLSQIAVLFRASFYSFDLEIELNTGGIPFKKVGGFKFMDSAHIKDVLAHLRILINPYDRISWQRILLLLDKIGPKTAQKIYEAIVGEQKGYEGMFTVPLKPAYTRAIERLRGLFSCLDTSSMSVSKIGDAIVNYYTPILKNSFDDYPKRARDLVHLVTIMERYDNLDQFLTDMILEPPNTSVDNTLLENDFNDNDRLVLSTIHSAKGLEWHTVFIIWALDGRFPSVHASQSQEELEEELRLMYVAATRAKENLFFLYPEDVYERSSGMILSRPSRFLDRIPDHILQKCSIYN